MTPVVRTIAMSDGAYVRVVKMIREHPRRCCRFILSPLVVCLKTSVRRLVVSCEEAGDGEGEIARSTHKEIGRVRQREHHGQLTPNQLATA